MSRYLCIAFLAAFGWLFSFEADAQSVTTAYSSCPYASTSSTGCNCYKTSAGLHYCNYTLTGNNSILQVAPVSSRAVHSGYASVSCVAPNLLIQYRATPTGVTYYGCAPATQVYSSRANLSGEECRAVGEACRSVPPEVPSVDGWTTGEGARPDRLVLVPNIGGWVVANDPSLPCETLVTALSFNFGIGGNVCYVLSGIDASNTLFSVPSPVTAKDSASWDAAPTLPTDQVPGDLSTLADNAYGVGGTSICMGTGCDPGGTGVAVFYRKDAGGNLREKIVVSPGGRVDRYLFDGHSTTESGSTVAEKRTVNPSGSTSDYLVQQNLGTPAVPATQSNASPVAVVQPSGSVTPYSAPADGATLPLPTLASTPFPKGSNSTSGGSSGGTAYSGGGPAATPPATAHDPTCGEEGQPACDAAGTNFPALTTDMFYTPKWAGFQAVYDAHKAAIDAVPALVKITSLKNLAFTPSNSCPKYSVDLPVVHGLTLGAFEFGLPCDAWPMMYTIMMITCGVISVVIFLKWG